GTPGDVLLFGVWHPPAIEGTITGEATAVTQRVSLVSLHSTRVDHQSCKAASQGAVDGARLPIAELLALDAGAHADRENASDWDAFVVKTHAQGLEDLAVGFGGGAQLGGNQFTKHRQGVGVRAGDLILVNLAEDIR